MSTSYVRYPSSEGAGVQTLNSLAGFLTIAGGTGISVAAAGSTITITNTGDIGFPLLAPNGSVSAPSYSFSSSTSTGLFSQGANALELATNGASGLTIDASQNVVFPVAASSPSLVGTYIGANQLNVTSGSNVLTAFIKGPSSADILDIQNSSGTLVFSLVASGAAASSVSIASPQFLSTSSNIAAAGQVRLAFGDSINFRNQGNSADHILSIGSNDAFQMNGSLSVTSSGSLLAGALNLLGATSGSINFIPAATTTTYTLNLPSAQGTGALTNNGSGGLSWSTSISGNAATATALQTARTINGTSFDGTANITVASAAGTLTGTNLNSTVVSSSLNSMSAISVDSSKRIGMGPTASPNVNTLIQLGGTNPSVAVLNMGMAIQYKASTSATTAVIGYEASLATAGSTTTHGVFANWYSDSPTVVSGDTITRFMDYFVDHTTVPSGVTNWAMFTDTFAFPAGNWGIYLGTNLPNSLAGQLSISTAGNGLSIKEGSNAKQGTATLSAGSVTVSNTSVTANSRIFLTVQSLGTVSVPTPIAVTARTAGTSFTITSASITDTSIIAYELFEPA